MQVVDTQALSAAFAPIERGLVGTVLMMLATGLTAAIAARLVFFWVPRKVRVEISGAAGGVSVSPGIAGILGFLSGLQLDCHFATICTYDDL